MRVIAPVNPTKLHLETPANVLSTSIQKIKFSNADEPEFVLLASTADRRLNYLPIRKLSSGQLQPFGLIADSPILSMIVLQERLIVFTTISGSLTIYHPVKDKVLATRKNHSKYAIQVVTQTQGSDTLFATAAWDSQIVICKLVNHNTGDDDAGLSLELVASVKVDTLPESIIFKHDPLSNELYLICTLRDSTFLYYYQITGSGLFELAGKQNLAPYANSWIAFSPSAIAVCPTDETLLAIATSSMPHMKVLFVRILYPRHSDDNSGRFLTQTDTGATVDPREAAAVLVHANTWVSQSQYSTPAVVWRPDGTGVWVNSEEGIIKGVDRAGKIQSTLRKHEPNTKIRCLWTGRADSEEVLVSGGFDQNLFIWHTEA